MPGMIAMWLILGGIQGDGSGRTMRPFMDQDGKVSPNSVEPLWIRTGVETPDIMSQVYQDAAAFVDGC